MTTVGYYEWQILEASLLTDCSFLDVVEHALNAQYSPLWCHVKGLGFITLHLSHSPAVRPVQEYGQD